VFGLKEEHQAAVLEMGISDFGEMSRLAAVARPKVMVITNIGICHLENLGTRDGILKAKTEVFDYLREDAAVILNGDDDKLCQVGTVQGKTPIFYGVDEVAPEGAAYGKKQVFADHVENRGLRGLDFDLHLQGRLRRVHVAIPGEHNVYNACAAAAVGLSLGLTDEEICAGIQAARTIGGRTNLMAAHDYLVIDDCYNANPVSMRAAIDVLRQGEGRTIAVLGDMGELGPEEKELHRQVGVYVSEQKIDVLFVAGQLSAELAQGARECSTCTEVYYYKTREQLAQALLPFVKPGDTILVKASHFMDYPKLVKKLTE
jgi:UDP-N-acetylmuramoyl-tripeptide--D-alanyl-D-alanine ligase